MKAAKSTGYQKSILHFLAFYILFIGGMFKSETISKEMLIQKYEPVDFHL